MFQSDRESASGAHTPLAAPKAECSNVRLVKQEVRDPPGRVVIKQSFEWMRLGFASAYWKIGYDSEQAEKDVKMRVIFLFGSESMMAYDHSRRSFFQTAFPLLTLLVFPCPGCSTQTDIDYQFKDSPSGATLLLGTKWKVVFEGVSLSGTDTHGSVQVAGIGQQQGKLQVGEVAFEENYSMGKAVLVIEGHRFEIVDQGRTLCIAGQRYQSSDDAFTELMVHADGSVTASPISE